MGTAVAVAPGAGFTGATAALNAVASDAAGFVTFTTATTIPGSGPYLLFTITWASSWNATYGDPPVISVFPCALFSNSRTAAQTAAVAALGPFFVLPNSINTTAAVYSTNAPAISTAYDVAYLAVQGP